MDDDMGYNQYDDDGIGFDAHSGKVRESDEEDDDNDYDVKHKKKKKFIKMDQHFEDEDDVQKEMHNNLKKK